MAESAADKVLRRMAEAGRGHGGGAPPTPARAFGLAAAKTAQDLFGLTVRVAGADEIRASLAELVERLPDRALLAVMAGPAEALGLVALSQEVLATLIEMQTTGRVGTPQVAPRRPTRTDAAMSQRFIDRIAEELELLLATDAAIVWAGGFRYASFLDDPRPLGVLFEDTAYRLLRLTLAFGETGARTGTVTLAVPAVGRGAMPNLAAGAGMDADEAGSAGRDGAGSGGAEWGERMERAVLGAEVQLEAVLDRMSVPLATVAALRPGALLPVAVGALSRLRIEGHGRRLVATGRLGQFQGNLAVRLALPAQDEDAAAGGGSTDDLGAGAATIGTSTPGILLAACGPVNAAAVGAAAPGLPDAGSSARRLGAGGGEDGPATSGRVGSVATG